MITDYLFLWTNVKILSYTLIYTYTLIALFWVLFDKIISGKKSLYFLSKFYYEPFTLLSISIILLSMAGVPPFTGFFAKLFILLLLSNSSLFLLYSLFVILLLTGLYFYVQNLRFLHSSKSSNTNLPNLLSYQLSDTNFFNYLVLIHFFIIFGFVLLDDLITFMLWILI